MNEAPIKEPIDKNTGLFPVVWAMWFKQVWKEIKDILARLTTLENVPYIKVSDVKAAGTAGGTFTAGAWQTRVLNTKDSDTGNIATLAGNQITLPAGTYDCRISAPAYTVNRHKAKLRNITAGADTLIGTSEFAAAAVYVANRSFISGRFTIAAATVFEVQHYCQSTYATYGFGLESNFAVSEVYTVAEFWKVA